MLSREWIKANSTPGAYRRALLAHRVGRVLRRVFPVRRREVGARADMPAHVRSYYTIGSM